MFIRQIQFYLLALSLIIISFNANAQTQSDLNALDFQKIDLAFIDYLINNQEQEDALLLLKQQMQNGTSNLEQLDSIYFYTGWAFYNLKELDSSLVYFKRINLTSPFYLKAKFYENFENLYLKQYKEADEKLEKLQVADSTLIELKKFQQASSALIQRDFLKFDAISNSFKYDNFSCADEQKNLFIRRQEILKNKRKSPFVAGLMSAVVPGAGKFYAGYRGQAISAMVPTLIFAVAAAESYYRAGPKSAQFIAAASLFSIFYVGNIWGSVLSVKTFYELRDNEIRNNIMLDLHIPLRRIFSN